MNEDRSGIGADKPCLPPYPLLTDLLREVSRSFYLTLRVLPGEIRPQIGLAYLLARAADTIADTKVVPRERRMEALLQLRKQFEQRICAEEIIALQQNLAPHQSLPAEKELIERLHECIAVFRSLADADRRLVAEVVVTLTRGMEFDLTHFPGESAEKLAALDKPHELDQYTYLVAGCVGPFWTKMCMAHLKELEGWKGGRMEELGIRFGKGLQLCNVLRDIPKDLRIGRCYLPASELATVGLNPIDLLDPASAEKLQPVYDKYLDVALEHLEAGWQYTMSVPPSLPRLRLACAWPILIALKTLARLRGNRDSLHPDRRIKISRGEVYGILARTFFHKGSTQRLNRYHAKLVQEAK